MANIQDSVKQLLGASFEKMVRGETAEIRQAGKKDLIVLATAHYNAFSGFFVGHSDLEIRNAGLDVAAIVGNPK